MDGVNDENDFVLRISKYAPKEWFEGIFGLAERLPTSVILFKLFIAI